MNCNLSFPTQGIEGRCNVPFLKTLEFLSVDKVTHSFGPWIGEDNAIIEKGILAKSISRQAIVKQQPPTTVEEPKSAIVLDALFSAWRRLSAVLLERLTWGTERRREPCFPRSVSCLPREVAGARQPILDILVDVSQPFQGPATSFLTSILESVPYNIHGAIARRSNH